MPVSQPWEQRQWIPELVELSSFEVVEFQFYEVLSLGTKLECDREDN